MTTKITCRFCGKIITIPANKIAKRCECGAVVMVEDGSASAWFAPTMVEAMENEATGEEQP